MSLHRLRISGMYLLVCHRRTGGVSDLRRKRGNQHHLLGIVQHQLAYFEVNQFDLPGQQTEAVPEGRHRLVAQRAQAIGLFEERPQGAAKSGYRGDGQCLGAPFKF